MNKLLIIDTATTNSSVSLSLGPDNLLTKALEPFKQTTQIIPIIEELLSSNNLTIKNLNGIAVCIGPGMFTGIRVGVMTAKTLSYASDIPLYPFSTFDLFKEKDPCAIIDAKCSRCHLYHKGVISLINISELNNVEKPIYCLDASSFKIDIPNLKSTTKDLSKLSALLKEDNKTTHDKLDVYYPK